MGAFDDFLSRCISDSVNAVSYDRDGQPFTRDENGTPVPVAQHPDPDPEESCAVTVPTASLRALIDVYGDRALRARDAAARTSGPYAKGLTDAYTEVVADLRAPTAPSPDPAQEG